MAAEKKKRYAVTLTPSVVNRFQSLRAKLGLPPKTLSSVCDEALNEVSTVFQTALDKGTLELSDLMKLMGKQVELFEEEERRIREETKTKRPKR